MMNADLLYGGDPCPACGAELGYEEDWSAGDIWLTHPDPPCGWMPSGWPSTRRGALDGRDPDQAAPAQNT